MFKGKSILAIVTARGGSKGIKGKNVKKLNGVPLINYSFEACKKSKYLDKTILSSDDNNIIDYALSKNIEVPFVRPEELASDESTSFDVIKHAVLFLENKGEKYDYIITIQPTSPFRTSSNIDDAIEILVNDREADSLVSVTDIDYHPYWMKKVEDGYLKPFMDLSEKDVTRRQNLPKLYKMNGAIFISSRKVIANGKTVLGSKVKPYYMNPKSSIDIDTIDDFKMAEYIIKNKGL